MDLEWVERNPVTDIPKLTGSEYQAWRDEQLDLFERHCDAYGLTTARTVYKLCVGTGQRLGDYLKMSWNDFDGRYMAACQEKATTKLWVYCPKRLQAYFETPPRTGRHILARNMTQPLGKRAVQKAVEDVRAALGLMHGENRLVPRE